MPDTEPIHNYNIRVPWSIWQRLEAIAGPRDKSAFILAAVDKELKKEEKKQ